MKNACLLVDCISSFEVISYKRIQDTASLPVLLKFLLWQQHHFCLFFLAPSLWICCGARSVHFTVSPGRKGTLYFIHIQLHNHQRDLDPCLWLYYYGNFIVELEKKNKKNKLFMVLVIWPSSTLNFLFVFDFKKCLSNLFLKESSKINFCHA